MLPTIPAGHCGAPEGSGMIGAGRIPARASASRAHTRIPVNSRRRFGLASATSSASDGNSSPSSHSPPNTSADSAPGGRIPASSAAAVAEPLAITPAIPLLSQSVSRDDNASREPEAGQPGDGGRHGPSGHWHRGMLTFARSGFIEYDRVLFFSDAVFAIAITLLAIDLRLLRSTPANEAGIDWHGLISFGISFVVIGLFWLGHHSIFRYIVAL